MAQIKWNDPLFEEKLIEAAKNNHSCRATLKELGILTTSASRQTYAKRKLEKLGVDLSHWTGKGHLKGKTHSWSKSVPLEEVLVENSSFSRTHLKRKLIAAKLLDDTKCSICNTSEWMGKTIPLHIDHINGVYNDNRLENLRLICPNCHAQTETYCGKNKALDKEAKGSVES